MYIYVCKTKYLKKTEKENVICVFSSRRGKRKLVSFRTHDCMKTEYAEGTLSGIKTKETTGRGERGGVGGIIIS